MLNYQRVNHVKSTISTAQMRIFLVSFPPCFWPFLALRKFILMQQLRYIKRELNLERDDKQSIIAAFKESPEKCQDRLWSNGRSG